MHGGRSAEKTALVRRIASKWPNMGLQCPPHAGEVRWRAVEGHATAVISVSDDRFDKKLAARSAAISLTGLLKSQLRQVQQLDMRRLVLYM
jgi:hypothetical protein